MYVSCFAAGFESDLFDFSGLTRICLSPSQTFEAKYGGDIERDFFVLQFKLKSKFFWKGKWRSQILGEKEGMIFENEKKGQVFFARPTERHTEETAGFSGGEGKKKDR